MKSNKTQGSTATKILIIDDNEAILHVLARVLAKQGYCVDSATTGNEALEKIAARKPDLTIVDLDLPDINGLELCRLIGARCPRAKQIILTGLPPERNEVSTDCVPRILVKPMTAEELIAAVEKTLNE